MMHDAPAIAHAEPAMITHGSHESFSARGADEMNARLGPVDPRALDAVVVTHAHLDHIGRLPVLAAHGYRGPIFLTPATAELTEIMLKDDAAGDGRGR